MSRTTVVKVNTLQGRLKLMAEADGLESNDLVILTVVMEKIIGDPVSYLLAQIEGDDGEAPERCDLSCPHIIKCYAYHEGELCEFQSSETSTRDEELIEKLAKLEHEQWSHWVQYMEDNWNYINLTKWLGQSVTPYKVLPEEQKESDREWARCVLEIIEEHRSSKPSANPSIGEAPVREAEGGGDARS